MSAARLGGRLKVDPTLCDGVAMCAFVAAELVHLDSWGYPIAPTDPLTAGASRSAEKAVAACPKKALHLDGY